MIAVLFAALLPLLGYSSSSFNKAVGNYGWEYTGPNVCVLPGTVQVRPNDTCTTFGLLGANSVIDIAGQQGEYESQQIFLKNNVDWMENVTVLISSLTSSSGKIDAANWEFWQVGYVFCNQSGRYAGSGGGWRPDPLLNVSNEGFTIPVSTAQSIWLTLFIPYNTIPNTYIGTATLMYSLNNVSTILTVLPISVTVWNIQIPTLGQSAIGTAWSGSWDPAYFQPYYNNTLNLTQWYNLFTQHRMPPDSIYIGTPRPISDYEYLASVGAQYFSLIDVNALSSSSFYQIDADDDGCSFNYNQSYVDELIQFITPIVTELRNLGISQYAYVYGFDEQPIQCLDQIYLVFGGIKAAFPEIRTMAALDWAEMPLNLPLDIWVVEYFDYNVTSATAWKEAGKLQFWYHCIEPSPAGYLNTFIERNIIQDRELFWLGALNDLMSNTVSGWLYYAVNLWNPEPGFPRQVMQTINGSSPYTNFNPANYIWAPVYDDIFANGDGQYVYPGPNGPISTIRLEAIRDGLEDWELFLQAGVSTIPALRQLVRTPTSWTEDPILLEQTRRAIGQALSDLNSK